MIETLWRTSDRYHIGDLERAGRLGDQRVGVDLRLRRHVRLWVITAAEGDPRRAEFLTLAQRIARLTHPAFLRVFDLVMIPDEVTLVIEAPDSTAFDSTSFPPALSDVQAAALALELGAALDDGARCGLSPATDSLQPLLYRTAEALRLDPVGLYSRSLDREVWPSRVTLVLGLLAALHPGGQTVPGDGDGAGHAPDSLAGFLARWRLRGPAIPDHLAPDFFAEVQALVQPPETAAPAPPAPAPRTPRRTAVAAPPQAPRAGTPFRWRVPAAFTAALACGVIAGVGILGIPSPESKPVPAPPESAEATSEVAPTATTAAQPTAATAATAAATTPASPNRATVSLSAVQDAQVRVSVDGASAYSGVLRAGEARSWDGAQRVQVWTNNGKNLNISVNGHALGPLSTAVGHPQWNQVDWGWNAGWKP